MIDNIRMVAKSAKRQQELIDQAASTVEDRAVAPEDGGVSQSSVADDSGLLPESNLTRMLRHNGVLPAWFTQRSDHESD